jgi:GTP cyclohydrolase II
MTIKATTVLKTKFGNFNLVYHEVSGGIYISLVRGDLFAKVPIIRLQSACLFSEAFDSLECDCAVQRTKAMSTIGEYGCGAIIYSYKQEGRGIGLEKKIAAMEIQRITGCSSETAFKKLGFDDPDQRDYRAEMQVLLELHVSKCIYPITHNTKKINALRGAGFIPVDLE